MKFEPGDFRAPRDGDRLIALRAAAEARGDLAQPEPVRCQGYANGCSCVPCQFGAGRKRQRAVRDLARAA